MVAIALILLLLLTAVLIFVGAGVGGFRDPWGTLDRKREVMGGNPITPRRRVTGPVEYDEHAWAAERERRERERLAQRS